MSPVIPESSRTRPERHLAVVCLSVVGLLTACYAPQSERLSCDDVDAPGSFDFQSIQALVEQDQLEGKGCVAAPCHSAETQRAGLRLDTPKLVYDELSSRPDVFYEALASGWMPHDGIPWDEDELKAFRSWYCAGAFPP